MPHATHMDRRRPRVRDAGTGAAGERDPEEAAAAEVSCEGALLP
eukprot:COSAG02_NODE_888_length_16167_cov_293.783234_6_plen_44_part_00